MRHRSNESTYDFAQGRGRLREAVEFELELLHFTCQLPIFFIECDCFGLNGFSG